MSAARQRLRRRPRPVRPRAPTRWSAAARATAERTITSIGEVEVGIWEITPGLGRGRREGRGVRGPRRARGRSRSPTARSSTSRPAHWCGCTRARRPPGRSARRCARSTSYDVDSPGTRSSSAAATTASSPASTSPAPGCGPSSSSAGRSSAGACNTEEFAPGFRASTGAYVLSMLRPAIWADMRLVERGIVVDQAGPGLNLYPDGASYLLGEDMAANIEATKHFSAADARALPRVRGGAARRRAGRAADLRHDRARPAHARPRRPAHAGDDGAARGQEPQAPQRAHPAVHLERRSGAGRALRERARPRGPRLARDQRQRRWPVDAGHGLRAAARPRQRHQRRRRPPVGLRARRDGRAHRADGRRGARGGSHGPLRRRGRVGADQGRPGRRRPPGCPARRSRATRVLSNADPKRTFLRPVRRRRPARRLRPRRRGLQLHGHQHQDQPRPVGAAGGKGQPREAAALPPRDRGGEPVHRRDGPAAGPGGVRHRGRELPRRALLPDRPRPVPRTRGQARRDHRRELAAVPPARVDLGRDQGDPRRPGRGPARAALPRAVRARSSTGRCSARSTWSGSWASPAGTPCTATWLRTSCCSCGRCAGGRSTAPRSRGSGCAAPARTPAAASPAPTAATPPARCSATPSVGAPL